MLRCVLAGCLLAFFPLLLKAGENLPEEASRVVREFEEDVARIRATAEVQVLERKHGMLRALRDMQDRYTKAGLLDQALAVRGRIEQLSVGDSPAKVVVLPAPDRLYEYRDALNQSFYFQVTGRIDGTVWGSDIYTGDSSLAAAAIHAGIVELGQTAVVRVTILPGQDRYQGSQRHGVSTHDYGAYGFSYRLEQTDLGIRKILNSVRDAVRPHTGSAVSSERR